MVETEIFIVLDYIYQNHYCPALSRAAPIVPRMWGNVGGAPAAHMFVGQSEVRAMIGVHQEDPLGPLLSALANHPLSHSKSIGEGHNISTAVLNLTDQHFFFI